MLEKIRFKARNKQSETYAIVLSDPLERREEGIKKQTKQQSGKKTTEEKKGEITKIKKHYQNTIGSRKEHIKNLSNTQSTDEQITLLSHGLKLNLSHGERCALKELLCDKNIILKKADKGTTTEGQVLLDDITRTLEEHMVETTAKNVQRMIKSLLQEGYIDDMTANGYPLRQTLLEYQYSTHSLRFTNRPCW